MKTCAYCGDPATTRSLGYPACDRCASLAEDEPREDDLRLARAILDNALFDSMAVN